MASFQKRGKPEWQRDGSVKSDLGFLSFFLVPSEIKASFAEPSGPVLGRTELRNLFESKACLGATDTFPLSRLNLPWIKDIDTERSQCTRVTRKQGSAPGFQANQRHQIDTMETKEAKTKINCLSSENWKVTSKNSSGKEQRLGDKADLGSYNQGHLRSGIQCITITCGRVST
ncbi:Ubiquitin Carboxyl-Terminal Hydrolase 19 [Manis pentadactyla]|nr:Ubiquitin Carboxyl-Terminal Hydrolase 19 [Manis pentadactyla]